jgi:hypothetical protein
MHETNQLRVFFSEQVHVHFERIPQLCKDRPAMDHIISILEEFTTSDELYRVKDANGHPITSMSELLADADPVNGTAPSFDYEHARRVYIGDMLLFFLGMYPEGIGHHPLLRQMNEAYLREIGEENYFIASTFDLEEYETEAPLYSTLSKNFPLCTYGLYLVKQSIEERRFTN